jgi:hypothetical protein
MHVDTLVLGRSVNTNFKILYADIFHCFIILLTGTIILGYRRTFHFHLCFSALSMLL